MPQLRRCPVIYLADRGVESPHTSEIRCKGNLTHGQIRLVYQFLGEIETACAYHRAGRGSQMGHEQPPKMACPNSQPVRERFHSPFLQISLSNQSECPG